ncbi:MAG TPA: Ig-like domain-containing protein, partial [Actinomycetota bacterium]|nr:Ig-like domain-containing protein [Actinomycetota bacterium]
MQAKHLAPAPAASDFFGHAVAASGERVVVGVPGDDDRGSSSGSAHVFRRTGKTWAHEAKLVASDGAAGDLLGSSVGLSGDLAVVGARGDDDMGTDSGSAYVFRRSGTTWTQEAKLTAADGAAFDHLGAAVAASGDTVVLGAPEDDDDGSSSGSVYVFGRSGGQWTQETKLTPGSGSTADRFGSALAVSGDDLVVGVPGDDVKGANAGAAQVFGRTGSSWSRRASLRAPDGAASDGFGTSVALSSTTAVIGAPGDDDRGVDSGSAHVFFGFGGLWGHEAKLLAGDGAHLDLFGHSVAASGERAVVGAPGDDGERGAAYSFVRSPTRWVEETKITAPSRSQSDIVGVSVALSGDNVTIGASRDDAGATDAGAAYTFRVHQAPVAGADAFAVDEDRRLAVPPPGVLHNDSDADGDPLTSSLTSGVDRGSLDMGSRGEFVYTPLPDFHGTDSFTYRACDEDGACAQATVTITVRPVNDAPSGADDETSAPQYGTVKVDVLANDTDPDGDALTVVAVGDPAHGDAKIDEDGTVTYTAGVSFK